MAISVLCPGCKARFSVSDKFAGKKGPCPKCKAVITVPELPKEEVKVHAPEGFGPKDSKGRAVLQPIFREETKFSVPVLVGAAGGAAAALVAALVLRFSLPRAEDGAVEAPLLVLALGALALAPPVVWGGYQFLRNSDLEPFRGQALWARIGICSLVYAALLGAYALLWSLLPFGEAPTLPHYAVILPALTAVGAVGALACFEMDYLVGAMHFAVYLTAAVVLRLVIGLPPL